MKKLIRKIVLWAFRNTEIQTSLTHGGRITKTPKVTGKGQVYFVNRYLSE